MMRRLTALSLSTLAVLSLVSIASIGGCPVNITTGEPNAAGDNTQDQPTGTTGDQTPTGGDTGGDTGGGDQGGNQGGGGDTGDQSSDDTATVGPGTPVFIGDEQPNNGAPNVVNQGPVVADATFFVNENVPIGTVVGTINMVDPDEGDTLTVTVTGGSGAGKFNVDPASGEITTAVGLNHEVQDSYTLETLVTDSGGLTDTATLLINVNDLNEAPVIENQAFNVHENVAIGTHVYTITASDPDVGDMLTVSVVGGDGISAFNVDPMTRQVTTTADLDASVKNEYTLVVSVADLGGLSATAVISITLNENTAPTLNNQTFVIDENAPIGSTVGTVAAIDPDGGDVLTYRITGGAAANFDLDSATGEITVQSLIDFETQNVFTLNVQVVDLGNAVANAVVTINVNNVNEPPSIADQTFRIADTASFGDVVGVIAANDPDAGDAISYFVTGGDGLGVFDVAQNSGVVTVATNEPFDRNVKPSYTLNVQAVDLGGLNNEAVITIDIEPPFALTATGPSGDLRMRPGDPVDVSFQLIDVFNTLDTAELVIAPDADEDGQPDGAAIVIRDITSETADGDNTVQLDTTDPTVTGLLTNGFGAFVLGVRATQTDTTVTESYAGGTLVLDAIAPTLTWVGPGDSLVTANVPLDLNFQTSDNTPHTVEIAFIPLDPNGLPIHSQRTVVMPATQLPAGDNSETFTIPSLNGFASGTYTIEYTISDTIAPDTTEIVEDAVTMDIVRISITRRLVGDFDLNILANPANVNGAILQGFNPNDLAGSSMTGLPDIDGDGADEIVVVSRFGKPFNLTSPASVGFGEAYMIYGGEERTAATSVAALNAVGGGSIDGITFPGIRAPLNATGGNNESLGWTAGMSDVTVVPDMDGDDLPELVFSFPRVESISLAQQDPRVLPSDLIDGSIAGAGSLEYDAWDPMNQVWIPNQAQFTRGGVVIVSSHNEILQDRLITNRKDDRVVDLHEVGQLFNGMSPPSVVPFLRQALPFYLSGNPIIVTCPNGEEDDPCTPEDESVSDWPIDVWATLWDVVFADQPAGGFHQPWNDFPADPPLATPSPWPYPLFPAWVLSGYNDNIDTNDHCLVDADLDPSNGPDVCQWQSFYYIHGGGLLPFPCGDSSTVGLDSWNMGGLVFWTGFYGQQNSPMENTVGARILGQAVEDRFGVSVSSDGKFLYIAAPNRRANGGLYPNDVPLLNGSRRGSGVVYQLRTDAKPGGSDVTQTQLWIEPGRTWPNVDREMASRSDPTMPVPHQYIVESVGSSRQNLVESGDITFDAGGCPPSYSTFGNLIADVCVNPNNYSPGQAGFYMDKTAQYVGPHRDAHLSFVRGLGDFDGDGIRDVAIGSPDVREDIVAGSGATVGALFVVSSRSTGLGGDILLEEFAKDPSQRSLTGVLLKGLPGETLARVIDGVGTIDTNDVDGDGDVTETINDFNGDGFADIVIGNQAADGGAGEVIILFGSPTLNSPAGGWTVDSLFDPGNPDNRIDDAVRITGVNPGDLAGANVAGAGDVDGDGFGDILIAAPGAEGGKGVVYLVYGSATVSGEITLDDLGTVDVPGAKFIGRFAGDMLGGGSKTIANTDPSGGSTTAESRGVVRLGDVNNDGKTDFAISAMLADPIGKQDAGEVYIIYGQGEQ